jgi:hypothetical protein
MRISKFFLLGAMVAFVPFSLPAVTVDEVIEKALFLRACPAPQSMNVQGLNQLQFDDIVSGMIQHYNE